MGEQLLAFARLAFAGVGVLSPPGRARATGHARCSALAGGRGGVSLFELSAEERAFVPKLVDLLAPELALLRAFLRCQPVEPQKLLLESGQPYETIVGAELASLHLCHGADQSTGARARGGNTHQRELLLEFVLELARTREELIHMGHLVETPRGGKWRVRESPAARQAVWDSRS